MVRLVAPGVDANFGFDVVDLRVDIENQWLAYLEREAEWKAGTLPAPKLDPWLDLTDVNGVTYEFFLGNGLPGLTVIDANHAGPDA